MSDNLNYIPKPHVYSAVRLESNLEILSIIEQMNALLPQLGEFINQFHTFSIEKGINIITDATGNMDIDVPVNMPDTEAQYVGKKISVIDRLINTRSEQLSELFKKGFEIEKEITSKNPNYTSQLTEKLAEFNRLNNIYKH